LNVEADVLKRELCCMEETSYLPRRASKIEFDAASTLNHNTNEIKAKSKAQAVPTS